MPHRHGYLDNTLIQIAGRITRTTPECFKVFMTGEVQPCLEQYHPASHCLWERCEVRSLGAIQAARRLPDMTGIVPNLIDIRLIRHLPAHCRLALRRDIRARAYPWQGQRPSRFPPYPLAPYALQGLGGKWLGPAWHRQASTAWRKKVLCLPWAYS